MSEVPRRCFELSYEVTEKLLQGMKNARVAPLFTPLAASMGVAVASRIATLVLLFAIVVPVWIWLMEQINAPIFFILIGIIAGVTINQLASQLADDRRLRNLAALKEYAGEIRVRIDASSVHFNLCNATLEIPWSAIDRIAFFRGGMGLSFAGMLLPLPYKAMPRNIQKSEFIRQMQTWHSANQ